VSIAVRAGTPRAVVTVYSTPDCHLCVEALNDLRALRAELEFELHERDITHDDALYRAYFERIPVIALDGEELFDYVVDEQILRERLESRT
jgi:glutaredoxin